ncbi:transmembrane emp24 domain-containing protein 7-like isoform X2 [Varroa jacobsoni]|uniref:GOLD domain-containing protein n=1 Tax=Varroa destructor TaxID=109461 RepID=A0A7M7MCX3_VARDE|nr:transmembrane emp24 domain-containing protein 7-like isoform X2 [Varroa destructor]XP_022697957.1 transmembrane emp24 domain-containing protein 7-like isoform X2 [Varroa jacobsoni]
MDICVCVCTCQKRTLANVRKVIRGGNGRAAFSVTSPTGHVLLPYDWKPSAEFEEHEAAITGHYQLCIDNSLSHFAEKLVSIYFNSFKRDNWNDYIAEIEKHGLTVSNFTSAVEKLETNLNEMAKYQEHTRNSLVVDWYLLKGNNSWVLYWSILQCAVIVLATAGQVYLIRSFFSDPRDSGGRSKTRI